MTQVAPITITAPAPVAEPAQEKMQAVLLNRNYVPRGKHEIVGWNRPARFSKNAAGELVEVEKAEFVTDQDEHGKVIPAPPPQAGVGTGGKIWKGTVIKLPLEEAKTVRKLGIGEYELAD